MPKKLALSNRRKSNGRPPKKTKSPSQPEFVSYRQIATHGAFWNIGLATANKVITLVGQVVLAWLLTPADMGVAGFAIAMVGLTAFLSAGGVGDVLLQRGRFKQESPQGLWLSIFLSVCIAGLVSLMIPINILSGRNDLTGLLIILAFSCLLSFANPILGTQLKSDLDFKRLSIAHFLEGLTYTSFALLFAKLGLGPYSLILPVIPRTLIGAGYIIWHEGWPTFEKPKLPLIRKLAKQTISLALTGFSRGLQMQMPILIVGIYIGATETGHFFWGYTIASQAVFLLATNLQQVLTPVFIKLNSDPKRQITAVLKAAKFMTVLLALACGLQALLAKPILEKFFSETWHNSIPVITWISLGLSWQGILITISSWLTAIGNYRNLLLSNAVPTLIVSLFTFFGIFNGGLEGAAIGGGIGLLIGSSYCLRFIPLRAALDETHKTLIPILLTITTWIAAYRFISAFTPLHLQLAGSMAFIFFGFTIWWHLDDGTFKESINGILRRQKAEKWTP